MFRSALVCLLACTFALFSTATTAQVLSRNYPGLTTPEAYLALSNGSVPFNSFLSTLSPQDVDDDGRTDLLVTGIPADSNLQGPITTTLLRNTGSGTFQQTSGTKPDYCIPAPAFWGPAGYIAPFCTLADLTGDGRQDKIFAVEYRNPADPAEVDYPTVKVEFATGPAAFGPSQNYVLGGRHAFIAAMATGDFNGDGRQDIAVLRMSQIPDAATHRYYSYVILLLANGDGGFIPTHAYATNVYDDVEQNIPGINAFDLQMLAVDLNGDGKSDLVVYPQPPILSTPPNVTSPFAVLLGRADGLTLDVSPGPSPFLSLSPADLNHDAFGDLLAAEKDGLHLLYGAGAHSPIYGYFGRDVKLSLGDYGAHIMTMIARDLNGDGRSDVLAVTWDTTSLFFQNADGSFGNASQYVGGSDVGAVLADINNDGNPDIVLSGDPLTILYGNGKGSFTGTRQTGNGYGGHPVTADFDRDGNPDVATVSPYFSKNRVDVFTGTGKGWFNAPKTYPVPNIYCLLAAGDVNGDGIPDLVVEDGLPPSDAGVSGPDTSVLFGRKDGTFAPPVSSYVGLGDIRGTENVFVVDVNKDGYGDLITDAGVALGKGDGTFGAPSAFPLPSYANPNFTYAVVADVNGDNIPDVVVSATASISVLLSDGTGHFNPGQVLNAGCGNCVATIAAGKLDSNSSTDLAAAYVDSAGVTYIISYLNDGAGNFHESFRFALQQPYFALYPDALIALGIADLTGDGKGDILVQSGTLGVLPGNGKGAFGQPIAINYSIGVFGSSDFSIADYNKDGYLDLVMPAGIGFGRLLNTGPKSWANTP